MKLSWTRVVGERRREERVPVDIFFNEYIRDRPFRSHAVNVSEHGLALTRMRAPDSDAASIVAVELALPGVGETIWAKAETHFEAVDREAHSEGIRFVGMARKHERMLRDFVQDMRLRVLALSWPRRRWRLSLPGLG